MMVTFVSECEKKALPKTRRVLDAFANRIGSRTWQTVITNEGLDAVKKLLRKTASKNTAVSCHWIRSRARSELVWIVGNRGKFNAQGVVPVNRTQQSILNSIGEEEWQYLPLIKALTGLAALLHDWGKASEFFQYKLMQPGAVGDPLRHEWVSLLYFSAFVNKQADAQWLEQLSKGEFDAERVQQALKVAADKYQRGMHNQKPFKKLTTPAAQAVAWLVLTHHRLPLLTDGADSGSAENLQGLLNRILHEWGYCSQPPEQFLANVVRCFDYSKGLPADSATWVRQVRKQAEKLQAQLPKLEAALADGSWRAVLQHCRLALMLGDHYYSSLEPDSPKRVKSGELGLIANTHTKKNSKKKEAKQTLDEHLLGVCKQALHNAHFLQFFGGQKFKGEEILRSARDIRYLKRKSRDKNYQWQDVSVSTIKAWRKQESGSLDKQYFGFFAVNMASTGKGKTFANAKIMQALSPDEESLRFVLALGLRTLTLQTGDEYRERVGLGKEDLAVLIGSRAVLELHQKNRKAQITHSDPQSPTNEGSSGSYSEETLLDNELDFDGVEPLLEESLKTVLRTDKERQFLYAPVLSCTIDHLMGATETRRGGRYILPTLRLMYSDLVIDEIDDFTGEDLVAIGRLIHLAGMLGRKVMISSATIPPDIAEGYFNTYQAGWRIYASMHKKSPLIGCAWVDEFKTAVNSTHCHSDEAIDQYQIAHQRFIKQRNAALAKAVVKRKAEIIPLSQAENADDNSLEEQCFIAVQNSILTQHQRHAIVDENTGKTVSFGIVRTANIQPCIKLTRYLLNADWDDGIDVRIMAYHSQQLLIMRNAQERHLDEVLKRKRGRQATLEHPLVRQHLNQCTGKQLIFILVATPVEEVGRDHSADWAVVEPSSYRSIIQLAGRVRRHDELNEDIAEPNIALLQYNLKGLKGKDIAFNRPGYESKELKLDNKDLRQLLDEQAIRQRLDASPRISRPAELHPHGQLVDLEHEAIHRLLTDYQPDKTAPGQMQNWLDSYWWLTAMPQRAVRFRRSAPSQLLHLYPLDDSWRFVERNQWGEVTGSIEGEYGIEHDERLTEREQQRLWLWRDYVELLEAQDKPTLEAAALVYGELNLMLYDNSIDEYVYSSQFGLVRK